MRIGGILTAADIPRVAAIDPDIVGVRSAACVGDRVHGRVSRERVAALARLTRAAAQRVAAVAPHAPR